MWRVGGVGGCWGREVGGAGEGGGGGRVESSLVRYVKLKVALAHENTFSDQTSIT